MRSPLRRAGVCGMLVLLAAPLLQADTPPARQRFSFDVTASPLAVVAFPRDVYRPGGGAAVALQPAVSAGGRADWIQLSAEAGYVYQPLLAPSGLSAAHLLAGPRVSWPRQSRVAVTAALLGGVYAGLIHGALSQPSDVAAGPAAAAEAGLRFALTPSVSLGMSGLFRYLHRVGAAAGVRMDIVYHVRAGRSLRVQPEPVEPVVPTLAVQAGGPLCRVDIANGGRFPASDLSLVVDGDPWVPRTVVWERVAELAPGARVTAEFPLPVSRRVLGVVQGLEVPLEIVLSFRSGGELHEQTATATVVIHDRNSIVWDDDRRAALFVTEKDEWVLGLAGNAASLVSGFVSQPVNRTFCIAAGALDALASLGVTYVVDPATPYAAASDGSVVDYLRFPRETVSQRAGDCDDLTVLYCALLESVGIRTALVTIPGHILAAVGLDLDAGEASRLFFNHRDLIYRDGEAWLPVEVTVLQDGFAAAWRKGAEQWRDHPDTAAFNDVRDAWAFYPPVALEAPAAAGPAVPERPFRERYERDMQTIIRQELLPLAASLRERLSGARDNPRLLNALGVLYARYGQLEDARELFEVAVQLSGYTPALVNLGNVHLLAGELEKARRAFQEAARDRPDDAVILLSLSRVHHELGLYGEATRSFDRLKTVDAELATENAYLAMVPADRASAADRAGVVTLRDRVTWMEEAGE